jgi:hypothetical protein
MRPFFLCIILLATSITVGASDPPEAGAITGLEGISEAVGQSNLEPTPEAEAGPSNPGAGSNTGGDYFRYGANVKIREGERDFYRNEEGKIRPADPSKKEKPKGLSVFDSLENGALVFHLN